MELIYLRGYYKIALFVRSNPDQLTGFYMMRNIGRLWVNEIYKLIMGKTIT